MRKITKKMKAQFKRYQNSSNTELSEEELFSLWDYDENYCNSDKDAMEYLKDYLTTEYVEEKHIEEAFYKAPKKTEGATRKELKENTIKAKATHEARMKALIEGLSDYKFLFGEPVEITSTEIKFIDNETNLPITIKVSKHKEQKVVSKEVKRKPVRDTEGNEVILPFSTVEIRSKAIENIILSQGDLFEAPSLAGTQFGFACRDIKYPFGSIKITHHRK